MQQEEKDELHETDEPHELKGVKGAPAPRMIHKAGTQNSLIKEISEGQHRSHSCKTGASLHHHSRDAQARSVSRKTLA